MMIGSRGPWSIWSVDLLEPELLEQPLRGFEIVLRVEISLGFQALFDRHPPSCVIMRASKRMKLLLRHLQFRLQGFAQIRRCLVEILLPCR